jgi:DNA-binding CsgD family transcriptional regulator
MLSTFAFTFDMTDGSDDLDARDWRAVALGALARSGDSLVVCDADLNILYCSPRASHLVKRLCTDAEIHLGRPKALPAALAACVKTQLASREAGRTDHVAVGAGNAVEVQASTLRSSDRANVSIYLREEVLRDDDLFAALKERYSITMRGFQLAMLIRKGLTNRQMAERLTLAESTVKIYLHQLYRACGVSSRTGLIALLDRLP